MSELSKQALKVENNTSFPNNNSGLITPQILRDFNTDMIDSLVDEIGYTADSASWNQQINALEVFTASFTGSATNTGSLLLTASFDNNTRNLSFAILDTTNPNVFAEFASFVQLAVPIKGLSPVAPIILTTVPLFICAPVVFFTSTIISNALIASDAVSAYDADNANDPVATCIVN